jgi:hypothetical protein
MLIYAFSQQVQNSCQGKLCRRRTVFRQQVALPNKDIATGRGRLLMMLISSSITWAVLVLALVSTTRRKKKHVQHVYCQKADVTILCQDIAAAGGMLQKEGTFSPYKSSLIKTQRQPEVVTLTEADVKRMMAESHVMTAQERSDLRHEIEERKELERAAAKARKEKMLRLEAEAKQQVCCIKRNRA